MKLALVFGRKKGEDVKKRLMAMKDNLDIECFENIPQFIDVSIKRSFIFDRILVLSDLVNSKNLMEDLYTYWGDTSKDTNIVVVCKKTQSDLATAFLSLFKTPVVAACLVDNVTLKLIAETVLLPTAQITDKYGIKDFLDVTVDDDVVIFDEPVPAQEAVQKPVEKPQQAVQEAVPVKKKKKGLFSGLFGGKKKDKQQEVQAQPQSQAEVEQEQDTMQEQDNSEDLNTDFGFDDTPQTVEGFDDSNEFEEDDFSMGVSSDITQEPEMDTVEEPIFEEPYQEETEKSNANEHQLSGDEIDDGLEEYVEPEAMFPVEADEVDEDFGDLSAGFTDQDMQSGSGSGAVQVSGVEDEDLGSIDVASAEEQYRKENEQPKVVTKEVVREVVRGGGSSNAFKAVMSGRSKKTIIVTGDRGSGVTSTCLKLAEAFAKKVQVLYVDCDSINHGLLSYIDYDTFRTYEQIHMSGLKLCRDGHAFRNCTINYATNLDIISTDYSCDVSEEELTVSQGVIAEEALEYGVVIVDCPVSRLHCISDLILTGVTVVCTEDTKRGFMNMLCQLESSTLPLRYKRSMVSKGTMLLTKRSKKMDSKKLVKHIQDIFESDGADWLQMKMREFDGNFNEKLISEILEG